MKDYYKQLGVNKNASLLAIKKQFRIKALTTHPDKTKQNTKEEFIDIYEAYAVLSNSKKRHRYDELYEIFFNSKAEIDNDEFKTEIKQITSEGAAYARDFQMLNKEILGKLLIELFFSVDDLLLASCITVVFGLWTIGKGLISFEFSYSGIGFVVTIVGLFFARLKIKRIMEAGD